MNFPYPEYFTNDTAENRLKHTFFLVEANSNEYMSLWEKYSGQSIYKITYQGKPAYESFEWENRIGGWGVTVGEIYKRPICISVSWTRINGKWVCFWYPTSQMVDYVKIEKWLDEHFKGTHDNGRRSVCDASSFHNCLHAIETANKVEMEKETEITNKE